MNEARQQHIENRAMLTAIGEMQTRPAGKCPLSDLMDMCSLFRTRALPEYAATLAFSHEIQTGQEVDIFIDLNQDISEWEQSDLEYSIDFETALTSMKNGLQKSRELANSGATNGTNIIDFASYKRRRTAAA